MFATSDDTPTNFAVTQWSLVRRAGHASVETRRASLNDLLRRYLPALRAHLLFDRRMPESAADDLLQGFVADKIVEQNLVARADPIRGKFRTFLLAALNNYAIDQYRQSRTAARRVNTEAGELSQVASRGTGAAVRFDLVWARELITRALELTRLECEASDRPELWALFECRVVSPAFGHEAKPYDALIDAFGLSSPLQAYNMLTTAKRTFARALREAAAEYAGDAADAEAEILDLRQIISEAGAR